MRVTPQQRVRLAVAAMAITLGLGVGAAFRGSDSSDHSSASIGDAGFSRETGSQRVSDLLTAPVEPGDSVKTGVTLPRGSRVADVMPAAQFTIESQTHTDRADGTWFEIVARNQGPAPLRFFAFISFDVPTTDGGI